MPDDKLRQQISREAARLLYSQEECCYQEAKVKAARRISSSWIGAESMPDNREVWEEVRSFARLHSADGRFALYRLLLLPLEGVSTAGRDRQPLDALSHSLQVFELGCRELPYDEEFLLAALLHDVGRAIDPKSHIEAGLAALADLITPRTAWLILHHSEGLAAIEGTLRTRARRQLAESPDFDELLTLARCDQSGRKASACAPELDEALDYLRQLADAEPDVGGRG